MRQFARLLLVASALFGGVVLAGSAMVPRAARVVAGTMARDIVSQSIAESRRRGVFVTAVATSSVSSNRGSGLFGTPEAWIERDYHLAPHLLVFYRVITDSGFRLVVVVPTRTELAQRLESGFLETSLEYAPARRFPRRSGRSWVADVHPPFPSYLTLRVVEESSGAAMEHE